MLIRTPPLPSRKFSIDIVQNFAQFRTILEETLLLTELFLFVKQWRRENQG